MALGNKQYYPITDYAVRVGNTEAEQRAWLRSVQRKVASATTRELFWLTMSVPFSGTSGETVAASTDTVDFDLLVRGIWSEFNENVRWRLFQSDSDLQYTATFSPLHSFAGNSVLAHPVYWLFRPIYIRARAALRAELISDVAQSAGDIVFICEKVGGERQVEARCTTEYRLTVDLANGVSPSVDHTLLLWGASVRGLTEHETVKITDLSTGYSWSAKPVKLGAIAGVQATGYVQQIVRWPCPMLLSPRVQLRVEASNPNGFLDFICERILY
jgi:hypothetical protein